MSYKKFLSDYRIEEFFDEKGRKKSKAVYTGDYYVFSPAVSIRDKRLIMISSILCWIALIGALALLTSVSRVRYVMTPSIISVLPLFLMTVSAGTLLLEGERMKREKADRVRRWLPPSSLTAVILSCAALLGFIINAVNSGVDQHMVLNDLLFCLFMLVIAAASCFVFSKCRNLTAKKTE